MEIDSLYEEYVRWLDAEIETQRSVEESRVRAQASIGDNSRLVIARQEAEYAAERHRHALSQVETLERTIERTFRDGKKALRVGCEG